MALSQIMNGQNPQLYTNYNITPPGKIDSFVVDNIDNQALLAEEISLRRPGRAPRYALNIETNISPEKDGQWEELKEGLLIWRYKIISKGAKSLNFGFGKFNMPETGKLRIYTSDYNIIRGPFTPLDNEDHEELWTPIIHSDELIIEVIISQNQKENLQLRLDYINHDFMGFGNSSQNEKSGACNLDVICGAADGFAQNDQHRDIMRSVAVISLGGGTFCTGFLVNNTNQDETPFFMTADHCGINSGNAPSLVTYWLYENSVCRPPGSGASGGPGDGTLNIFNTGSVFRASYSTSDMTLVELDDPVNPNGNTYFAGWRNDSTLPTSSIAIHHPSTDEKRISYENQSSCSSSYGVSSCSGNTHIWVDDWDIGTTEPGSSGSPLFDQNEYIIGQLHGGSAACGNNLSDWYGWFHVSWTGGGTNSTRLSNWLDPTNTGSTTLVGLDSGNSNPPSGNYTCETALLLPDCESVTAPALDQGNGASQPGSLHAVWYKYTATNSGFLSVRSCDGGTDTRLFIHDGSCNNLNLIAFADDECQMGQGLSPFASEINDLFIAAGTTVYIEWDDFWSSNSFDFEFEFNCNYTCEDRISITNPGTYTCPTLDQGSGANSSNSPTASNAAWYEFIPNLTGEINIYSCDGGADTRLWVYDGTCSSLNLIASADDDCQMGTGQSLWASEIQNLMVVSGEPIIIEWDDYWSSNSFDFTIEYVGNCPPSYSGPSALSGIQSTSADFETDGMIESTQTITGASTVVDYDSGASIMLNAGFEVVLGAILNVFIDGCGGAMADEEQKPSDR